MNRRKLAQPRQRIHPRPAADELPPHDLETERALVGCILEAGAQSQAQVDAILSGTRAGLFFDPTTRAAWCALRDLRAAGHAADAVTFASWVHDKGTLTAAGVAEVVGWQDLTPSLVAWPHYVSILTDKARRRSILAIASKARDLAKDSTLDAAELRRQFAETLDDVSRAGSDARPRLVVRKASERKTYAPPAGVELVGTAEIRKGTEGLALLAGPGSSGKSLAIGSLALAGAIGSGTWMGRKVHRRFKTLIIQGEVGPSRLKSQIDAFARNHPEADLEGCVFYSDPPEGGMSIRDAEFWGAVRRQVRELRPDLVVFDPISHLGVVDDSSEVMEALRIIREAVGVGDDAPGILLVAHTKKPRSEDSMRGRNLAHAVSGSVAWVNTSRVTYLCVPWSEDLQDDRIYWSCPKINDAPNYAPTVWRRRFGTFFAHDAETDPSSWGIAKTAEEKGEERQKIRLEDLRKAFGNRQGMKRAELVKALVAAGHDEATCYRATRSDGYLSRHLAEAAGVVSLRSPILPAS